MRDANSLFVYADNLQHVFKMTALSRSMEKAKKIAEFSGNENTLCV